MQHKGTLTVILAATLLACASAAHAAEPRATNAGYTTNAGHAKARYKRANRPLQVDIYARRRGGYAYTASDIINTYGQSPPPYADIRQTPNGPFDHGFFFDSGIGPHGGSSPYLH